MKNLIIACVCLVVVSLVGCSSAPERTTATIKSMPMPAYASLPVTRATQSKEVLSKNMVSHLQLLPIYFKEGEHAIHKSQLAKLENNVTVLVGDPSMRIKLVGQGSATGTNAQNFQLGLLRANVIKNYLIAAGVPAYAIVTVSEGKFSNTKSTDTYADRKVEFVLMP